MDREIIAKLWNEAWDTGLWAASWRVSVDGLTAEQAAWKPAPNRHSVWQLVNHIIFWREVSLRRLAGGAIPDDAELARRNWPDPSAVTEAAWKQARDALEQSQRQVAAKLADPSVEVAKIPYVIAHDAYHMGQINYLRALQGLKPIE